MIITRKIALSMWAVVALMLVYAGLTMYAMFVIYHDNARDKDRNLEIMRNVDSLHLAVAQQVSALRGELLVISVTAGTPVELQRNKGQALAAIANLKLLTGKDELAALDDLASNVTRFYQVSVRVSSLAQAGDKQAAIDLVESDARTLGDLLAVKGGALVAEVNKDIQSVNDHAQRQVLFIEIEIGRAHV